jgi:hypothetical protein
MGVAPAPGLALLGEAAAGDASGSHCRQATISILGGLGGMKSRGKQRGRVDDAYLWLWGDK